MVIMDEYWLTWSFLHLVTLTTAVAALIYISYELPMAKLWGIAFGFLQGLTAPRRQTKTETAKKEDPPPPYAPGFDAQNDNDDNKSAEVDEELEMSMQKLEKM